MLSKISKPKETINIPSDINQHISIIDILSTYIGTSGLSSLSITERDTLVVPSIDIGSFVEVNGDLYSTDTLQLLTLDTGLSDGIVHIKLVQSVDENTLDAVLTSDSLPEWDTEKAGWYNISGERFLDIVMTKVGTEYSNKGRYVTNENNIVEYFNGSIEVVSDIDITGDISVGSIVQEDSSDYDLKWMYVEYDYDDQTISSTSFPNPLTSEQVHSSMVLFSHLYTVGISTSDYIESFMDFLPGISIGYKEIYDNSEGGGNNYMNISGVSSSTAINKYRGLIFYE